MKIKNIAFSGFMASILMIGAAYADNVATLATTAYVGQGVNYAIAQANEEVSKVVNGEDGYVPSQALHAVSADEDGDGVSISGTYLKKTDASNTYLTKAAALEDYVRTGDLDYYVSRNEFEQELQSEGEARGTLSGKVTALESALNTAGTGLKAKVATLESDLNTAGTGLKAKVTALEGQLGTIGSDYLTQTDREMLTGNINDVDDKVTALENRVTAIGNDYATTGDVGSVEEDVSELKHELFGDDEDPGLLDLLKCTGGTYCLVNANGAAVPVTVLESNDDWDLDTDDE